jgi:photosystem II stability/assembly factor-like uncharacterized protein
VTTAAFTKAGTIYTTNGTTWHGTTRTWITQVGKKKYKQPYGFGVPECVSASVCFAAAQGGGAGSNVVSTADGGKNWQTVFVSADLFKNGAVLPSLNGLECLSTHSCLGVGNQRNGTYAAQLVHTVDGGHQWGYQVAPTPHGISATSEELLSIECLSKSYCWIAGTANNSSSSTAEAVAFQTADGGKTWNNHVFPAGYGNTRQVTCVNIYDCWALVGAGGNYAGIVFQTTNGGKSWYQDNASQNGGPIFNIDCLNFLDCWTSGSSGFVSVTTDGGAKWAAQIVAGMGITHWISCPSVTRCWATADVSSGATSGLHVITTADGGFRTPLPSTPSGLRVTRKKAASLSVSWKSVAGARGYDVYEASPMTGVFSSPTPIVAAHANQATITNLKPGKTYAFEVTALDASGDQSPPSNSKQGTA